MVKNRRKNRIARMFANNVFAVTWLLPVRAVISDA